MNGQIMKWVDLLLYTISCFIAVIGIMARNQEIMLAGCVLLLIYLAGKAK